LSALDLDPKPPVNRESHRQSGPRCRPRRDPQVL